MRKVFKYATGEEIPEGAVYVSTVTQTKIETVAGMKWEDCWFVWHYFLVEIA